MVPNGGIDCFGGWWSGIRESVLRFAGITTPNNLTMAGYPPHDRKTVTHVQSLLPVPTQNVITHLTRQGVRRHLIPEHHDALVLALEQMVKRKLVEGKDWTLNIVQPELLTREDQLQLASESTVS
jgi:exonuclease I